MTPQVLGLQSTVDRDGKQVLKRCPKDCQILPNTANQTACRARRFRLHLRARREAGPLHFWSGRRKISNEIQVFEPCINLRAPFGRRVTQPPPPCRPVWVEAEAGATPSLRSFRTQWPGVSNWKHLSMSHVRPVIGLPEGAQDKLLSKAEEKKWSIGKVEAEAAKLREKTKRSKGGRPPLPKFLKSVLSLSRFTEDDNPLLADLEVASSLPEEKKARNSWFFKPSRKKLPLPRKKPGNQLPLFDALLSGANRREPTTRF